MNIQNTRQIISGLLMAGLLGIVFTACSKDDDPMEAKANMKFTVTVNGADSNDQVDFLVKAGNHDASQYGNPVWKMNGVAQGNEDHIQLEVSNFTGSTKTYVFETVKPFNFSSMNVTVSNLDGGPVSISYKAEVGGNVETNENKSIVAGQTFIKDYSYTAK